MRKRRAVVNFDLSGMGGFEVCCLVNRIGKKACGINTSSVGCVESGELGRETCAGDLKVPICIIPDRNFDAIWKSRMKAFNLEEFGLINIATCNLT